MNTEIDYGIYGPPDHKGEFDLEKLEKALQWTLETFKARIVYEHDRSDVPRIFFIEHTITEDDIYKGLFLYPVNTTIVCMVDAEIFAKLYSAIILDDRIKYNPRADHEEKSYDKIAHIIAFDEFYHVKHGVYIQMLREQGFI